MLLGCGGAGGAAAGLVKGCIAGLVGIEGHIKPALAWAGLGMDWHCPGLWIIPWHWAGLGIMLLLLTIVWFWTIPWH